jgi:hypothetical protein
MDGCPSQADQAPSRAVTGGAEMQYQIDFLDGANLIVHMAHVNAESPAIAFWSVVEEGWPPGALAARVFDNYGLCQLFLSNCQTEPGGPDGESA